jgi:hypothetical protein
VLEERLVQRGAVAIDQLDAVAVGPLHGAPDQLRVPGDEAEAATPERQAVRAQLLDQSRHQ